MDKVQGEIRAEIEEGELRGTVEFWNGDESDFRAVKKAPASKSTKIS